MQIHPLRQEHRAEYGVSQATSPASDFEPVRPTGINWTVVRASCMLRRMWRRLTLAMLKNRLALSLMLFASQCMAQCDTGIEKIDALVRDAQTSSERVFYDCRAWPSDATKTIVAIARLQQAFQSGQPSTLQEGAYELSVFVLRTHSGEITDGVVESDAFRSDALSVEGLAIDTAHYRLANGVAAVGVRYRRANRQSEVTTLNLYIPGGGVLKRVVHGLDLARRFSESASDLDCYHVSDIRRTLRMARSKPSEFADIIVQEKHTEIEAIDAASKCKLRESRSSKQYVLRFDGSIYPLPRELASGF